MYIDTVIGQEIAVTCLRSIIKKPENCPSMILIVGPYGTGRKYLAHSFVRDMNIVIGGITFNEYDFSRIDQLNEEDFIIITNFEKTPRELQIRLVEYLNTHKSKIILIAENTTDILDSIKQRSLILRTSLLIKDKLEEFINLKESELNIKIPEDIRNLIIQRSCGSLSYLIRLIENYRLLDKEDFIQSVSSAREYYICFLVSCYRNNKEDVDKYITKLKQIPLNNLKKDYESLILEILKVYTKVEKPRDNLILLLSSELKNKALDLYYIMNDKVIYNSFESDDLFQTAMYVIYLKINNRVR